MKALSWKQYVRSQTYPERHVEDDETPFSHHQPSAAPACSRTVERSLPRHFRHTTPLIFTAVTTQLARDSGLSEPLDDFSRHLKHTHAHNLSPSSRWRSALPLLIWHAGASETAGGRVWERERRGAGDEQ